MPPADNTQFLLGAMDSKLDTLVRRSEEDRKVNAEALKLHSDRLEKLEAFRWYILGAAAAIGAIASVLVKVLT